MTSVSWSRLLEWQTWAVLLLQIIFLLLLAALHRLPARLAFRFRYSRLAAILEFFAACSNRRVILTLYVLAGICLVGLGASLIAMPHVFLEFPGGVLLVFGFQLVRAAAERSEKRRADIDGRHVANR